MAMTDSARDELRSLRDQVNQLMDDRVTPAFNDASKRAYSAANDASKRAYSAAGRARAYTEDQAEAVSEQVRDMPLIAVGVALAIGFLVGRITK